VCYFFNSGHRGGKDCTNGDRCKFNHVLVSDAVFEGVAPPARSGSPAVRIKKIPRHCSAFLSTGKCDCVKDEKAGRYNFHISIGNNSRKPTKNWPKGANLDNHPTSVPAWVRAKGDGMD
jgi:hypothetical protein